MKQWGAEIAHLEGLCRFLLPLSYTELQVTAHHGPVIILIASQHLCSAIIVPMLGEPHDVRFPHHSHASGEAQE
ncbi:hypothetical protein EV702DRAFT_1034691 [Suillus placidus]|uniref:Uncharacterized protein n=1 Tax=Suillus placidus TaxID=48579 RepID=A0A9P6ZL96_9AGAM|nr:hypothetical protein EV702DRAFT_1034691 [Suillus placidus]